MTCSEKLRHLKAGQRALTARLVLMRSNEKISRWSLELSDFPDIQGMSKKVSSLTRSITFRLKLNDEEMDGRKFVTYCFFLFFICIISSNINLCQNKSQTLTKSWLWARSARVTLMRGQLGRVAQKYGNIHKTQCLSDKVVCTNCRNEWVDIMCFTVLIFHSEYNRQLVFPV